MLGIYSFSNELWISRADLDKDGEITEEEEEFFDKYIDMDNKAVPLHEIDHPQLGKVAVTLESKKVGKHTKSITIK